MSSNIVPPSKKRCRGIPSFKDKTLQRKVPVSPVSRHGLHIAPPDAPSSPSETHLPYTYPTVTCKDSDIMSMVRATAMVGCATMRAMGPKGVFRFNNHVLVTAFSTVHKNASEATRASAQSEVTSAVQPPIGVKANNEDVRPGEWSQVRRSSCVNKRANSVVRKSCFLCGKYWHDVAKLQWMSSIRGLQSAHEQSVFAPY